MVVSMTICVIMLTVRGTVMVMLMTMIVGFSMVMFVMIVIVVFVFMVIVIMSLTFCGRFHFLFNFFQLVTTNSNYVVQRAKCCSLYSF
ncbi:hypothetical protein Mapa_005542 [Marchantia paleacea]|nr:hypothetical protein Mapa_005542 [Marchantia paleacea]